MNFLIKNKKKIIILDIPLEKKLTIKRSLVYVDTKIRY